MADEDTDAIPADWYPDAQGTVRWWDGTKWTEHVRGSVDPNSSARTYRATPSAEEDERDEAYPETQATRIAQALTAPTKEATAVRPSYEAPHDYDHDDEHDAAWAIKRKLWLTATVVGLAAFFLGLGLGTRGQDNSPSDQVTSATSAADLDQRQADLDQRETELNDRSAALDKREKQLLDTPDNPTSSPDSATATSIDGDETVQVGTDVMAGTYYTTGPSSADYDCSYVISRDEEGTDVVREGESESSASVTLANGQWFESTDCKPWTRR